MVQGIMITLGILLAIAGFAGLAYAMLINSVKKEVKLAPRVPMHYCEIHGVYPAKHTIRVTVPTIENDQAPLTVEMCTFCYDQKMKTAEKVIKNESKTIRS